MIKTVTAIVEIQLKPIIDKKLCLVKELTEEEIYGEGLLQYMNDYYCPEWFEITAVDIKWS